MTKKIKRLNPVIELRKNRFDDENQKLNVIRQQKINLIAEMKQRQRDYMTGLERLNNERGTINRNMLEALEIGLDNVKQDWMNLYHAVLEAEKLEKQQIEVMSFAHRELEAIKQLQTKYSKQLHAELERKDQLATDELALRKFYDAV